MRKVLIIGGGPQGEAIAYDFLHHNKNLELIIGDIEEEKALSLQGKFGSHRVTGVHLDATNKKRVIELMDDCKLAVNASSYDYNYDLTRLAILTHCNFIDLGGNPDIVKRQLQLFNEVRKANAGKGLIVIPDLGIAPGAVSILVKHGINIWGMPDKIKIRVGGLPVNPESPLYYALLFSARGLINEYKEPVEVIENGIIKNKKPLTGIEKTIFRDERFLKYFNKYELKFESAYTAGGSSTLTDSYLRFVKSLNYKTVRFKGHWKEMQKYRKEGYFEDDKRKEFEKMLEDRLPKTKEDMMLVKVQFVYDNEVHELNVIDFFDKKTGHTAMQRTTGYSAAIVGKMILNDEIDKKGVLRIEDVIEPVPFFKEWEKRNIYKKAA